KARKASYWRWRVVTGLAKKRRQCVRLYGTLIGTFARCYIPDLVSSFNCTARASDCEKIRIQSGFVRYRPDNGGWLGVRTISQVTTRGRPFSAPNWITPGAKLVR